MFSYVQFIINKHPVIFDHLDIKKRCDKVAYCIFRLCIWNEKDFAKCLSTHVVLIMHLHIVLAEKDPTQPCTAVVIPQV